MYKNLNPASLGISGRQSELIELTLTYGFRGMDLDAADLLKRATVQGVEEAGKYIRSAKIKIGGWAVPVRLGDDDSVFQVELERLGLTAETARKLGFSFGTIDIDPASDKLPYHENFERHRQHLSKVGDVLAGTGLRLAVGLKAAPEFRRDRVYPFIHKAEELVTLIRTVNHVHVGLALDTWNWQVGEGGPDLPADLNGKQIVSVSIADVPADADLGAIAVSQRLLPTEETIPQHARLIASLAGRKYVGPVTLLPAPTHVAGMTRDHVTEKCASVLEQVWMQAGLSKPNRPLAAPVEPTTPA
ncbi:MAG: TIM barrel protein [Candidatus Anammoximicrobium sp.]|nr:TIM barrel protein [Candidatus Anammoximicrobium sp.]